MEFIHMVGVSSPSITEIKKKIKNAKNNQNLDLSNLNLGNLKICYIKFILDCLLNINIKNLNLNWNTIGNLGEEKFTIFLFFIANCKIKRISMQYNYLDRLPTTELIKLMEVFNSNNNLIQLDLKNNDLPNENSFYSKNKSELPLPKRQSITNNL